MLPHVMPPGWKPGELIPTDGGERLAYKQVAILRARVEHVIAAMDAEDLRALIGTMIELPRGCFIADKIAGEADFFSFGTNDLTQTALDPSLKLGICGEHGGDPDSIASSTWRTSASWRRPGRPSDGRRHARSGTVAMARARRRASS